MLTCARHLAPFNVLVGLLSDNPFGPACSDPGAFIVAGPSCEASWRSESVVDQW